MPYRPGAGPQKDSGLVSIADVYRSDNVYANNVPIALHNVPGAFEGGVFIPIEEYIYDQSHAEGVIAVAGISAPFDDENAGDGNSFDASSKYPNVQDTPPPVVTDPITSTSPGLVSSGGSIVCKNFAVPVNYDEKLSANFAIRSLSVSTLFPHSIQEQNGLSIPEILCNLQGVAENILEPLRVRYPGFRINSGFRKGSGTSQHNKGQAVDLQWPGLSPEGYTPIAYWIRDNLPFDQLIFEHGNSIWLHVSYDRTRSAQRNTLLTYYPKASPNYKSGLTNHYA